MSVTITANQALPGDIIRDRDGNLWTRESGQDGQGFSLTYVFTHVHDSILPAGQDDIEARTLDLLGPLLLMMRNGEPVGDELPPAEHPRVVEFEWALHGGSPYEERDSWSRELGFTLTDELLKRMGRPFYEVILRCTLDTATGHITILEAK
jgi:hypothetical protein